MKRFDPRVRWAFDSQAELRGQFLAVLAGVAPHLLPDLWTDRNAAAWAGRHGFRDEWIVEAVRSTMADAAKYRGGTCPPTFAVDLPDDGGWVRDVNGDGAVRPGRPAMRAPSEPGGLRRFLARWRKYTHRLAQWSGQPSSARWHATPDHMRWCALRLTGASWSTIAAGEAHGDDRLVRRRVQALAGRLGLTLP